MQVLPARLKTEMEALSNALLNGEDLYQNPLIAKHAKWAYEFSQKYGRFDSERITEIIEREIGIVFTKVLEDAGVYKCTSDGREAFQRFIDYVNT